MTITRLTLVTGLAAALGIGAGCRDVRAPTADQQAKHVVESQDPNMAAPMPKDQASPPAAPYQATPGSDRQPVSGAELSYVTDDGKRGPIADPDTVTQIEQKLSSDGLYKGPIDGQPSADVVDSVRRFKAENRLGDDAAIDHATANRLGLDW